MLKLSLDPESTDQIQVFPNPNDDLIRSASIEENVRELQLLPAPPFLFAIAIFLTVPSLFLSSPQIRPKTLPARAGRSLFPDGL